MAVRHNEKLRVAQRQTSMFTLFSLGMEYKVQTVIALRVLAAIPVRRVARDVVITARVRKHTA